MHMYTSGAESPASLLSLSIPGGGKSIALQPVVLLVGGHPHIWEMAASALRLAGYTPVELASERAALVRIGQSDRTGTYPAVLVLDPPPFADATQAFLTQVQGAWALPLPLPSLVRILADHWRPARLHWREDYVLPKPFRVHHFLGVIEKCISNSPV